MTEEHLPGGIIAQHRDLEVGTLPRNKMGPHRATLAFRWPDGQVLREGVAWVVDPLVSTTPSGWIVRLAMKQTLLARSPERAFKVLAVSGPAPVVPVPLPEGPPRMYTLVLGLRSSDQDGGQSTIQIVTNHPDQPEIATAVITIGSPGMKAP